jgi:hypothetical protein
MKPIFFLLMLLLFGGCLSQKKKAGVFKTDKDFVEFWRKYSPDGSMLLINFAFDLGALGYGQAGTAILKPGDTTKNLRLFSLSNQLDRVQWVDSKTVSAKYDTIPYIREGKSCFIHDSTVNGIQVKISSYDYIEPNTKLDIEHREKSPDGKNELIAYRYNGGLDDVGPIHVSVIPTGGQIPKYGNFLIGDIHSDYVLNGEWNSDNTLVFYSNHLYADMVKYYLVHDRPDIKYQVVNNDVIYGSRYRWIGQGDGNIDRHM